MFESECILAGLKIKLLKSCECKQHNSNQMRVSLLSCTCNIHLCWKRADNHMNHSHSSWASWATVFNCSLIPSTFTTTVQHGKRIQSKNSSSRLTRITIPTIFVIATRNVISIDNSKPLWIPVARARKCLWHCRCIHNSTTFILSDRRTKPSLNSLSTHPNNGQITAYYSRQYKTYTIHILGCSISFVHYERSSFG